MVLELVVALEALLAYGAVELASHLLILLFLLHAHPIGLVLFLIVLLDLLESLHLQFSLHFFHFLLLFLLFLLLDLLLSLSLLFLLLLLHDQLPVPRVPLLEERDEVFNGFDIGLLFFLPFFLVFLFHRPLHIAVGCISCVPIVSPHKCLVGREVLPVLIELNNFVQDSGRHSEALILSHLFFEVVSHGKSLGLFLFQLFEDISVDLIESSFIIFEPTEARDSEVVPDVKAESVDLQVFLAHVLLVEEDFLAVVIVPGALVGV